jgi:hypothetical protein
VGIVQKGRWKPAQAPSVLHVVGTLVLLAIARAMPSRLFGAHPRRSSSHVPLLCRQEEAPSAPRHPRGLVSQAHPHFRSSGPSRARGARIASPRPRCQGLRLPSERLAVLRSPQPGTPPVQSRSARLFVSLALEHLYCVLCHSVSRHLTQTALMLGVFYDHHL